MNAAGAGAGAFTAIGLAMAGLLFGVCLTLLAAGVMGVPVGNLAASARKELRRGR